MTEFVCPVHATSIGGPYYDFASGAGFLAVGVGGLEWRFPIGNVYLQDNVWCDTAEACGQQPIDAIGFDSAESVATGGATLDLGDCTVPLELIHGLSVPRVWEDVDFAQVTTVYGELWASGWGVQFEGTVVSVSPVSWASFKALYR